MLANQNQHIFINLIFHRHKRHLHIHEPDCQHQKPVRDFQLNMADKLDVFVSFFCFGNPTKKKKWYKPQGQIGNEHQQRKNNTFLKARKQMEEW